MTCPERLHRIVGTADTRRYGLQIAAAAILAYAGSIQAGLPDPLWAVMTALIVMRPDVASALGAGLSRARSTIVGAACGVLCVWLTPAGRGSALAVLGVAGSLAYLSATAPALRGAPIASLIILSSNAGWGHTALDVAFIRFAQILIGVAAALTVALVCSNVRASDRLRSGCARLMRGVAADLLRATQSPSRPLEPESQTSRARIVGLFELARNADYRGAIFPHRLTGATAAGFHVRLVTIVIHLLQDVAVLARVLNTETCRREPSLRSQTADVAVRVLVEASNAIEMDAHLNELQLLARPVTTGLAGSDNGASAELMLTAQLNLLLVDLQHLSALISDRSTRNSVPCNGSEPEQHTEVI
jgi:uncharacterized membrane protein YccC